MAKMFVPDSVNFENLVVTSKSEFETLITKIQFTVCFVFVLNSLHSFPEQCARTLMLSLLFLFYTFWRII